MESYGAYRIYDEGSSSGTYVNYERVSLYPRELNDKDDIHLGRVHVRFHLASSLAGGQGTEVYRPENSNTERY
jgi:predicted component of type VI protein secretion system